MSAEEKVYVIAEAGVNHNGDPEMALRLIDVAADAGADAVKFQTFVAGEIAGTEAPKAEYQQRGADDDETQLAMLAKLELSPEMHAPLIEKCRRRNIDFLSTPFDAESARFLAVDCGLKTLKIASGEITNGPLLLAIARTGKPVILSTGMSTLEEVEAALAVLSWGFRATAEPESIEQLLAQFRDSADEVLIGRVTLLHCTSQYPAPDMDANLRAIATLAERFGLPVGYSDHTQGIHVSTAAVALGATVIEKHFTLDKSLPGPDHAVSLEPGELAQMIVAIRGVEAALGDGKKVPRPSERDTRVVARRSLVAAEDIAAGDVLTAINMTARRPGDGGSPMTAWRRYGTSTPDMVRAGKVIPTA